MGAQDLLWDDRFVAILSDNLIQPLLYNPYTADNEGRQDRNHIVGFGVEYKSKGGRLTNTLALVVYVRQKLPIEQLAREEQVREYLFIDWNNVQSIEPSDIYRIHTETRTINGGGIPTDVQPIGEPQLGFTGAASTPTGTYIGRERPVVPGLSIGWKDEETGTLGCFVRDKSSGKICILSAAHVLGKYQYGQSGDIIVQPGVHDGGQLNLYTQQGGDNIATFVRDVPVHSATSGKTNKVDAAIAELFNQNEYRSGIKGDIGTPVGQGIAEINMLVKKTGKTSGYSLGEVKSTQSTFRLDIGGVYFNFTDLICTTIMSKKGDSGSLLLSLHENKALGLLMGASESRSFYCKFTNIASELNIELP